MLIYNDYNEKFHKLKITTKDRSFDYQLIFSDTIKNTICAKTPQQLIQQKLSS